LTTYNAEDRHGATSHLSTDEIADLAAFLKSLPFEDPVEEARRLGMKKNGDLHE
jgi:cytochrome c553